MPGNYSHTPRTGTLGSAAYNADHQNHIDNHTPTGCDDYSSNIGQMQSSVDPGELGSESLPTSLAGELERLRFALKETKGTTHWYQTPAISLAGLGTNPAFTGPLTVNLSDDTSVAGPEIVLMRTSATPAVADTLGILRFRGKDSGGGTQQFGSLFAKTVVVTAGAEEGLLGFNIPIAGAFVDQHLFGKGYYQAGVTGGDLGVGTVNATGVYRDGVLIRSIHDFISAEQTITSGGSDVLAHGLPTKPRHVTLWLKCTTAENGYSIGDEVLINPGVDTADKGLSVTRDATNITIRYGSDTNALRVLHKTNGTVQPIANANWRLIVEASTWA